MNKSEPNRLTDTEVKKIADLIKAGYVINLAAQGRNIQNNLGIELLSYGEVAERILNMIDDFYPTQKEREIFESDMFFSSKISEDKKLNLILNKRISQKSIIHYADCQIQGCADEHSMSFLDTLSVLIDNKCISFEETYSKPNSYVDNDLEKVTFEKALYILINELKTEDDTNELLEKINELIHKIQN